MSLVRVLRLSVVLFLIFPFLLLLTHFQVSESVDWGEVLWAAKNSFNQAFFSALFSMLVGFWVALGLLSLRRGTGRSLRSVMEILCLLPNFLPPIFIILSTLNVIDPFPMGVVGVVIIHTFMNFGLVAVLLSGIIESRSGGIAELAYVEGATKWHFLSKGLVPYIRKDILLLSLFIFVVCFGSFSVPLIVGGGKGTTIEVLIYEKIRLSSDWGGAVLLALLQSLLIFAISFFASRGNKGTPSPQGANLNIIRSPTGLLVLIVFSLIYFFGYFQGFVSGVSMLSTYYDVQSAILWNFLGTMGMGLTVGAMCFAGLMLIAYVWPSDWFAKFLSGYVAPSTALACFSLLIVGPNEGFFPFIKIPLAITLLSLTSLFRMGWDGELNSLSAQITVAHAMGASRNLIFREVLFPQLLERGSLLAGIGAVWACGDFAVSRILAHRDLSIAMMTETLMSGYRLNQATALSGLIILAAFLCFVFFVGGGRVLRRKLAP